ncbi:MAG: hypothetical protein E6G97_25910 [Alphaproteobacteria bacterium]|nr:MAG: hypothetical protein E6G97_25910 [Alphaproteobacteria bacterium]
MTFGDRLRAVRASCMTALTWCAQAIATGLGNFDGREWLLFAGLALVGYGLYDIYAPLAFIVPGGVLSAVAFFGVR